MFSEMMRMRPACARKPVAAIAMLLRKSMGGSYLVYPTLPIAVLRRLRLRV